jgi:uncharacterized protein involved in outer membrane biogenesis
MNTKYADSYIFSGTGSTSPFELVKVDEDHPGNDKLYYRGVNVDTGLTKDEETKAADYTKTINDPGKSTADKATAQTALDGLDTAGTARLKTLAGENNYIDIGLGLTVNNGKVDSQSAYDSAMTGNLLSWIRHRFQRHAAECMLASFEDLRRFEKQLR